VRGSFRRLLVLGDRIPGNLGKRDRPDILEDLLPDVGVDVFAVKATPVAQGLVVDAASDFAS
jgi:hypothetical protein